MDSKQIAKEKLMSITYVPLNFEDIATDVVVDFSVFIIQPFYSKPIYYLRKFILT